MALLTDGSISTLADLQAIDSSIFQTAEAETVDLEVKLKVAEEAIGGEISAFLLRTKASSIQRDGTGACDLRHIVVTSGVKRWHKLRTLCEVYSDVYNSQFNDRYKGKWQHFLQLSREAKDLALELGIGIVDEPISRPEPPLVALAGSGGPVTTYVVKIRWTAGSGVTSALSVAAATAAPNGELITVTASGNPSGVTGFDLFAAINGEPLQQQNTAPIQLGSSWTVPPEGLVAGASPGDGQSADYYVRPNRVL